MSNSTPTPFLLTPEQTLEEFLSLIFIKTEQCMPITKTQLKQTVKLEQQILSGLKLIRLVEEDIHIYEHSVCILDEGGECVNCNAKELLEALLEESRKK